ncbi:hypothetical protein [Rubinisphaera brasiliensis]|uniref:Uncharacterized protein n=1 Tax=Rubinisphaera brasiliensis (strain ATCC 49424 / DSM 5305 / JCM 21570 / IAM 15109 / NBRC 103401 / IFAM 1448) TaxID=756272 RepID=F0SKU2_RUBBR|nr:hypothetical protein [Rubinisphaera brasiliensis]ADY58762.1 hypothetical protein Plabr_1146 [Rubinisphaera brasiliensis DSM 5305]
MRRLEQLGDQFEISIPPDENGYIGRECPECEQYFKITLGTGIIGGDPICHCPYCGHSADQDQFFTEAQIEYAQSVVINKVTGAFIKDLKSLEFNHRPKGPFGIGFSMKVEGRPEPIRHYRELELEEEVICDQCTLRYTIYGTFAYCPDCGRHNSRQILDKNLALSEKQIALASQVESDLAAHLISDALENGVSAFDGFGRETCRVHAFKAKTPAKAEKISFQNLSGAQKNVGQLFGIDLASALGATEWTDACRNFQKRHLLAHKMGIVDEAYVKATADPSVVVGRKVSIQVEEVESLLKLVGRLGSYLSNELDKLS